MKLKSPVGTRDIVAPESWIWAKVIAEFSRNCGNAGYDWLLTPIFEDTQVFQRAVGGSTDIVQKEMYDFQDKSGRNFSLRPEETASVVRSFIEHRPAVLPWKVHYWGPMFRYERPQAGRYRQFYQLGIEALGVEDPSIDVEVISILWDFLVELGITSMTLRINSLGDALCRENYLESLHNFLLTKQTSLCDAHRDRISENPQRVLDCKTQQCIEATRGAPEHYLFLCDPCRDHFEAVKEELGAMGIPFVHDPRLVRGLDYYTRTTFEISSGILEGAQNALGGGGRYDGLVEEMGGPPTPAIGFSIGLERLVSALGFDSASKVTLTYSEKIPQIFVVDLAQRGPANLLFRELRRNNMRVMCEYGRRSAKAQFRSADRSQASIAIIVGQEEADRQCVVVRPLKHKEILLPLIESYGKSDEDANMQGLKASDQIPGFQLQSGQAEIGIDKVVGLLNSVLLPALPTSRVANSTSVIGIGT